MPTILQDFFLMLYSKELIDSLLLLLKMLIMVITKSKETVTEIFLEKVATGKGDDYTTGCLLNYQYFKNIYQLIAVGLSKQKKLDPDPKVIQQIEFYGMLKTNSQVCTVLEKSKETVLEFYKGTAKVL